jgi:hypothetical protein
MKRLALGAIAALLLGGVAAAAPPVTITSPSGTRQVDVNSDLSINVRALATPQTVISGRQTATASAVALPSGVFTNGLVIRALASNAGDVCIGGSGITTGNGYCLSPGEAIAYGAANSNQIYIVGDGNAVMWTGN